MLSENEKATLELSRSLDDISDYRELWQVYQQTISKIFPIDWLGIYSTPVKGEIYNVTSNPHLPFNWDELYQEIAPYDIYRERTLSLPLGQALIYEEIRDPHSEIERYCLDYVKRHTDTVHMMAMPTVRDDGGLSGLGLYRSDQRHGFTLDEKQMFMNLGPLFRYAAKKMMLLQRWDLKRVAFDKLFEAEAIRPVFLDRHLGIIDLPLPTLTFLRRMFDDPLLESLPQPILAWISGNIAPHGEIAPHTGPWRTRVQAVRGSILCHAYVLTTKKKHPVLIVRFEPHGNTETFSELAVLGLTEREIEALSYLPLGYTNKQIAMAMSIGEDGVKKYFKRLSRKLNASGRTELLYQALTLKRTIKLYGSL